MQIVYFFMRSKNDTKVSTFMSAVDEAWGRCRAIKVDHKGASSDITVKWLVNFCQSLGVDKLYIRSDPE